MKENKKKTKKNPDVVASCDGHSVMKRGACNGLFCTNFEHHTLGWHHVIGSSSSVVEHIDNWWATELCLRLCFFCRRRRAEDNRLSVNRSRRPSQLQTLLQQLLWLRTCKHMHHSRQRHRGQWMHGGYRNLTTNVLILRRSNGNFKSSESQKFHSTLWLRLHQCSKIRIVRFFRFQNNMNFFVFTKLRIKKS